MSSSSCTKECKIATFPLFIPKQGQYHGQYICHSHAYLVVEVVLNILPDRALCMA